jgi:hypothetical protein
MFDNGVFTIGVYGFKDGLVYVMDPHDWNGTYLEARSSEELKSSEPEFLEEDVKSAFPEYRPLTCFPIQRWDLKNYCILECIDDRKSVA